MADALSQRIVELLELFILSDLLAWCKDHGELQDMVFTGRFEPDLRAVRRIVVSFLLPFGSNPCSRC
jgi:hypothetical protein